MICSRHVAEQSRDLKHAIKVGSVKIIRKDMNDAPMSMQTVQQVPQADPSDKLLKEMQELRKEMIDRQEAMARKQQALIENSEGKGGLGDDAQAQLTAAIAALQALAGGQQSVVQPVADNSEFDLPDDRAVEIHKRTINKLSQTAKGNIKHEESSSTSNADDKVSELEDLLGG